MSTTEDYITRVNAFESRLRDCAKKSIEPYSQKFIDGRNKHEYFAEELKDELRAARLAKRTPLQIERDRILYSPQMRKQTEKYHVLYSGQQRIIRNYITHTMRMAQVTRSICTGLNLNADFGEAIALGSKVGASPFIHAAKEATIRWINSRISDLDRIAESRDKPYHATQIDIASSVPSWLQGVKSQALRAKLERFIPCPSGNATEPPYSAGQHGYWVLCTNPYAVEPAASPFSGETIYGIWRHTRGLTPGRDAFAFQQDIGTITHRIHKLDRSHATYEATAVQYADDITWIIENLNDANNAWILDGRKPVYEDLLSTVRDAEVPNQVLRALVKRDPGALYTYFIDDFVRTSEGRLTELAKNGGTDGRVALREAKPEAAIGLSAEAEAMLKSLDSYLTKHIFAEQRVAKRKEMLGTISSACLELLHKDNDGFLEHHVRDQAKLLNWTDDEKGRALELVADDVHRVQLAVTTFAGMGDVEIFNFVGISAS